MISYQAYAACLHGPVSSNVRRRTPPLMPSPHPAEFMRFSAPDPAVLERSIRDTRSKLAEALSRGDQSAILDCAADLGGMLTTARNEAEALDLLRTHESLASSHPSAEQIAWFWNALGTALQYIGERPVAEAYFAKAVATAHDGGWRRIEAMALHHWGRSLVEQGRLDEAESRITQALAIREELGEPRQETSRKALAEIAKLRAASDA
jgi:tetratricopeptide (TPR) repeat protein